MKYRFVATSMVMILATASCGDPHWGLTKYQIADLRKWEAQGQPLVVEKRPETATVLAFILGFGAFHTNEPVLGVIDLLFWPISVLWEPWIAPKLANGINYEATKNAWEWGGKSPRNTTREPVATVAPKVDLISPVLIPSVWSRLRRGLDQVTVRDLLGEPAEESVSTKSTGRKGVRKIYGRGIGRVRGT